MQTICILSGGQYTTKTRVHIVHRKGNLLIVGVHFRDNVGDAHQPGMRHSDCVYSSTTSLRTEKIKYNIYLLDSDLLLDFCCAPQPFLYSLIDIETEPRRGIIAEWVQAQLLAPSLLINIIRLDLVVISRISSASTTFASQWLDSAQPRG
ncbi:hypothetical protein N9L68_09090 [bacterium]|nr:hypothetical protein [bacterium]